jgi:hypothetical protein
MRTAKAARSLKIVDRINLCKENRVWWFNHYDLLKETHPSVPGLHFSVPKRYGPIHSYHSRYYNFHPNQLGSDVGRWVHTHLTTHYSNSLLLDNSQQFGYGFAFCRNERYNSFPGYAPEASPPPSPPHTPLLGAETEEEFPKPGTSGLLQADKDGFVPLSLDVSEAKGTSKVGQVLRIVLAWSSGTPYVPEGELTSHHDPESVQDRNQSDRRKYPGAHDGLSEVLTSLRDHILSVEETSSGSRSKVGALKRSNDEEVELDKELPIEKKARMDEA